MPGTYDKDQLVIARAIDVVTTTYGDTVSVARKGKAMNKFGRNLSVASSVNDYLARIVT